MGLDLYAAGVHVGGVRALFQIMGVTVECDNADSRTCSARPIFEDSPTAEEIGEP